MQNINPLPSNDNWILFSFTSKICCCIQWNTLWWKNWDRLLYYQVKEDFKIIKAISIQNKDLTMKKYMSWKIKSRILVTSNVLWWFYGERFIFIWWNENSREFSVAQTHWWFDRFCWSWWREPLMKKNATVSLALAFLLRSVVNPFKFSLANFATENATASQIVPLFWKAVASCKTQYTIKVVATTCDGASANFSECTLD